jgi:hypothetical protein
MALGRVHLKNASAGFFLQVGIIWKLFTPLYPDTHNNPSAASTAYSDLASHAADPPKDRLSDTFCSTRLPAHLLAFDLVRTEHTRPVHPYQLAGLPASPPPLPSHTASVQKAYRAAAYHTRPAWAVNVCKLPVRVEQLCRLRPWARIDYGGRAW